MKPTQLIFGLIAIFSYVTSAFAIDDITQNNVVINASNPLSTTLVKKIKGSAVCDIKGTFVSSTDNSVRYASGYSIINAIGLKNAGDQFGSYSSTLPSILHLNIAVPGAGAETFLYMLDTTTSKYVVNKYGIGLAELHWQCMQTNPAQSDCTDFVDQMGFTLKDAAAKEMITSHINQSPSNYLGEQNVTCTKR